MGESSSNLPSLTILGGPMAGKVLLLDEAVDNVLIGSDPACKFHLPLSGVSPIHARIWVDLQGITVYDANSPRGLYINDERVSGQAPIRNGDVLWLGAPGDDDVVMLQCKVPPRGAAPPRPVAETTVLAREDETVMLGAPPAVAPEPPTVEVAPKTAPGAFEIVEEHAVEAMAFEIAPEPAPPPPPSEAFEIEETHILAAPAPMPESQQEPTHFAVDLPRSAAPLSAVPAFFEDETAPPAPKPDATVAVAPPPPAPKPARPPAPKAAAPPRPPRPPRPAPPPPMPMAAAAPTPPRSEAAASPMGRYAVFGVLGLVVLGGGIFGVMQLMKPSAIKPPPVTAPQVTSPPVTGAPQKPPPTAPTPEPVEEAVTIVTSTPPHSPKPADAGKPTAPPATTAAGKPTTPPTTQAKGPEPPPVNTAAAQVAGVLGQADAALAAHDYDAAAGLYEQALKLDPQNARATSGKTTALAGAAAAKRTFVAGRTSVQGGKTAKGGPSGFDDADVSLSKAPDYSGRIEFEAPKSVRAGESYSVKVYLVNDGKKAFKIGGLTVAARANGAPAGGGAAAPPTDKVDPQKRVLLAEVPGVWADGVNSWSLDVSVTSDHGDAFKNTLTWK